MPTKSKTKAKPKRIAGVHVVPAPPRRKNPPRTAFKKGGPNPHAFKPGQSGNPDGGRPKSETRLLSRALLAALPNRAPSEVTRAFGLKPESSNAQCLAHKLIVMGLRGDLGAISEIRSLTEVAKSSVQVFDEGSITPPPLLEIVFVESDGNGYPKPGSLIDREERALASTATRV